MSKKPHSILNPEFPPNFLIPHLEISLDEETPVRAGLSQPENIEERVQFDMHYPCEMGIVLSGKFLRVYRGSSMVLERGGIWWSGMWEPHGSRVLETGTRAVVIVVLPEFLVSAGISSNVSILVPFIREDMREDLQPKGARETALSVELSENIHRESTSAKAGWKEAISLDLLRLNHQMLRKLSGADLRRSGPAVTTEFERLQPAFQYIRENLSSHMTLAEAASSASMSRSSFASIFKRTMGKPFAQYVLEIRLEHARRDLLLGGGKVESVALRWGFVDGSHLTRHFSKHFGQAPAAYRQKRKK